MKENVVVDFAVDCHEHADVGTGRHPADAAQPPKPRAQTSQAIVAAAGSTQVAMKMIGRPMDVAMKMVGKPMDVALMIVKPVKLAIQIMKPRTFAMYFGKPLNVTMKQICKPRTVVALQMFD